MITGKTIFKNRRLFKHVIFLLGVIASAPLTAVEDAPQGSLVIVGGGEQTDEIINRFVDLAGAPEAKLVVIPTASPDKALSEAAVSAISERWHARGIKNTVVLHTRDQDEANRNEFSAPLRDATAVWISGGAQTRIASAYVGTKVQSELHALLQRGGVIGGTSAGAAIQSDVMIENGNPIPNIGRGLGLLPNVIIDQHFLARNRGNRLIEAIRRHPNLVGIGIDEATALVVQGSRAEVIGNSYVVVVTAAKGGQPTGIRTLAEGDEIDLSQFAPKQKPEPIEWAIAVHGGAGTVSSDAAAEEVQAWRDGLKEALDHGKSIVEDGGSSLDAVAAAIRALEDNALFNAGKGAVFNSAGEHELDASIMDGQTMDGGAVAGVRTVRNPIELARLVMDNTSHVLLSGPGVEQFATEQKVKRVLNGYFSTERRRESWQRLREKETRKPSARLSPAQVWQYGTVGCVVLDTHGNLAAGTSTGGRTNKKFGRVGDSPILGAGTYADNETCGVSGTGVGEQFIRHSVASQISQLIKHRGWTLKQSAEYVLNEQLNKGDGGVIAIDRFGKIEWVYTSPGMFRAAADSEGRYEILIRDEESSD